jgi:dihydrofolate synthase / folylpolyglutamate synthase
MAAIQATDAAIETWLAESENLEKTGDFRDWRLERIQRFVALLPAPRPPCTVTGTKGKGSTVRLIESALVGNGVATVAFTSPHVTAVRERWRLDGVLAPLDEIAEHCARIETLERHAGERLSYFERCFAIACLLSAARPHAAFLCEVGLGGRLDCANTLDAAVLVVTHLSRDHCHILGPTVTHIAREKLALARDGQPVVIAPQSPEGERAIAETLRPAARPLWVARTRNAFTLRMPGGHQQDNASAALVATRLLCPSLDDRRIRAGMADAALAARCQMVRSDGRTILIDGAHNAASIRATLAVARQHLRPGWRMLLGLAKDKDLDEIAAELAGVAVARVGYRSARARSRDEWSGTAIRWPWHDTLAAAIAAQPSGCDLCITGSFYLAGEALARLDRSRDLPG